MQSSIDGLRRSEPVAWVNAQVRRLPVWAVYLLGALPAAWIVWLTLTGGLGVDPVKEIEHRLGKLGLQFLLGGLAVTPLRAWAGVNLLRFRRALGLLAFWYVLAHLFAWVTIDMGLLWGQMGRDILKRPYITIGMAALVLLLPLAVTSNSWSIRRLGPRWRQLHRLVYVAAALGAIHFIMLVRTWQPEPLLYLAGILALLALRLGPPKR
ncbi:protein-methionine-sulfoxide reductase heme-binding subunit MsrQ [Frigidibacter sp. MR17.24]|uniref:protein-methionine-sulfoxide reductase heme-binding subunit MsrQ n=1 Tax=Frigidibacter sp. MR17.24 TaxID=3127345 RepID=UPI003012CB53